MQLLGEGFFQVGNNILVAKIKTAILFILFIAAYWIPLNTIVRIWNSDPDYSYGFLIPFCSLYFIWENKKEFSDVFERMKTFWLALPALVFAVILSVYGILGSSGSISKPIIPVLLLLFLLFMFGLYSFKKLFMPVAFLIFMVPLPYVVQSNLAFSLKRISSIIGGALISLCNIPVFISGNVIDIGGHQLQVVDACNGIRYLIPLLALSVAYGYLFEKTWRRILACAVISVPFAVLANGIRIGVTGVLVNFWGTSMAEGTFHDMMGWGIFVLVLPLAYGSVKIVFRFVPGFSEKPNNNDICNLKIEPDISKKSNLFDAGFLISVSLLLIVLFFSMGAKSIPHYTLKKSFNEFSLNSFGWKTSFDPMSIEIIEASASQDYFNGYFVNENASKISLFIGYMFNPFLDNANFFHSPTVCLPGSGWQPISTEKRIISNVPIFKDLAVTEMIVENMGARLLVYFWFQTKDKATDNKQINRMHLSLHAIKGESTYDLFIRPITEIGKNESIDDARKRMDAFIIDTVQGVDTFIQENKVR